MISESVLFLLMFRLGHLHVATDMNHIHVVTLLVMHTSRHVKISVLLVMKSPIGVSRGTVGGTAKNEGGCQFSVAEVQHRKK